MQSRRLEEAFLVIRLREKRLDLLPQRFISAAGLLDKLCSMAWVLVERRVVNGLNPLPALRLHEAAPGLHQDGQARGAASSLPASNPGSLFHGKPSRLRRSLRCSARRKSAT